MKAQPAARITKLHRKLIFFVSPTRLTDISSPPPAPKKNYENPSVFVLLQPVGYGKADADAAFIGVLVNQALAVAGKTLDISFKVFVIPGGGNSRLPQPPPG
jgi:hypothetical protein